MRNRIAPQPAMGTPTGVEIFPPNMVRRRMATWTGIQVESLELTRLERFECRVKSSSHILIVAERGERDDGETVVEGFQRSTQREFSHKLNFIRHCFHGWQDPRVLMRCTYLSRAPLVASSRARRSRTGRFAGREPGADGRRGRCQGYVPLTRRRCGSPPNRCRGKIQATA
jgi:hypothetical protein